MPIPRFILSAGCMRCSDEERVADDEKSGQEAETDGGWCRHAGYAEKAYRTEADDGDGQ